MSRQEFAAPQRQFGAENWAAADGLAVVYRWSARRHEETACRLDTEAGPDAPQGPENGTARPVLRLNNHAGRAGP